MIAGDVSAAMFDAAEMIEFSVSVAFVFLQKLDGMLCHYGHDDHESDKNEDQAYHKDLIN